MFWQACYVWSWLAVNAEVAVILLLTRVSAYIGMPCGQSSAKYSLQPYFRAILLLQQSN